MLKRNLIANYLGQGWVALMGLAFIPLYIKYLGIEAYGLVGLFGILQALLSLFDMGMTPTLSRELARYNGGGHSAESIRDLLRSVEIIAFVIAVLVAGGVALASPWIAGDWLRTEKLPVDVVARAFAIMGLVTSLRFIEAIYRSSLVGLQRQVLLNVASSVLAALRWGGAVGVLAWISPTIEAFFLWQGLVSFVTTGVLAVATYSILPRTDRCGCFSVAALSGVWQFAGGMTGVTFLVLLLTQVDKVILSKLLPLSDYGRYTLASTIAGALSTLVSPIAQAWYPRLCELYARDDTAALSDTYHTGAQLVSVVAGSAAIVIIVLSEVVLEIWTQDPELARSTASLLSILMLGNLLNAMMWIPYQTQLAYGWTSHAVRVNSVAALFMIPAILWVTPVYGAIGAAWAWVALNAGYILISVQFMYRRILSIEKWRWYTQDVILPLIPAFLVVLTLRSLWPTSSNLPGQLSILFVSALAALIISSSFARRIRLIAASLLKERLDGRNTNGHAGL